MERQPTREQLQALEDYAARHGRQWKRQLLDDWLSGRDAREPQGPLLRQLRNRFGPRWLQTYARTGASQ
jgi:hypothetical protein